MTHFLQDILRQPQTLRYTLEHLRGAGKSVLQGAAAAVRDAREVYLTGIGSSWHAALTAAPFFYGGGQPVYMVDATDMLQSVRVGKGAVLIVISRSGKSIEIVQLLDKARESGASVIGVTNSPEGDLAQKAQFPVIIPVALDHAISVNTYSTLALAAGMLGVVTVAETFSDDLAGSLLEAFGAMGEQLSEWQDQVAASSWLRPGATHYFLARGSSLGSCQETRLLWEEGVKSPATAMGTGSFRHGPQEMVAAGARFGIWINGKVMREQDLEVARDLQRLNASVMLIGQNVPVDGADLVFQLPAIPAEWQFLVDIVPAQLTAEQLARMSGVDSDNFRYCSFIVKDEGGLLGGTARSGEKKP